MGSRAAPAGSIEVDGNAATARNDQSRCALERPIGHTQRVRRAIFTGWVDEGNRAIATLDYAQSRGGRP